VVTEAFGTEMPVPAIVQNGNGTPGVGEEVGRRIIPAGFRVVLSQNAASFNLPTTDVIANGEDNLEDAKAARKAIGVGRVGVSQVPSGLGDITIVVGEDFTA
jgi:LytR cell envelope-related transcriptional attenuator